MYHNHSGLDTGTQIRHCLGCKTALHDPHRVLSDHVSGTWYHYLLTNYPDVYATDEDGKTLEGVISIPARRVVSLYPSHNGISFCTDCLPKLAPQGCGGCGEPVDLTGEHSRSELLWMRASGYNGPLRFVDWHIECLPRPQFDAIRKEREARQS